MDIKSETKKKLDVDLWIIFISTMLVIVLYNSFSSVIIRILKDKSIYILLRLLLAASFQFGVAGLGITIISLLRKEKFSIHGLNRQNVIKSIILCSLCFIPNIIYTYYIDGAIIYVPFRKILTTSEIILSGFPVNVIGLFNNIINLGLF